MGVKKLLENLASEDETSVDVLLACEIHAERLFTDEYPATLFQDIEPKTGRTPLNGEVVGN